MTDFFHLYNFVGGLHFYVCNCAFTLNMFKQNCAFIFVSCIRFINERTEKVCV